MTTDTGDQPKEPAARAEGVRWNTSAIQTLAADVASATAAEDGIILNFGATQDSPDMAGATEVVLLGRLRLEPRIAKHLHEVLVRLVSDVRAQTDRRR